MQLMLYRINDVALTLCSDRFGCRVLQKVIQVEFFFVFWLSDHAGNGPVFQPSVRGEQKSRKKVYMKKKYIYITYVSVAIKLL